MNRWMGALAIAGLAATAGILLAPAPQPGDGDGMAARIRPAARHSGELRPHTAAGVDTRVPLADVFARYAATTAHGWTGGDSTFSLRLPDGRTLWMFSDTYLGPLNRDGTRPADAPIVNNTFVIQEGDQLSTVHGGTAASPTAVMPPAGRDTWYWVADGTPTGDDIQIIFQEYRRTGPGVWDFAFNRNALATFTPSQLATPARVDPLPSAAGIAWGAAILPAASSGDGYTYVYGVLDTPTRKGMRVARVSGTDLRRGRWQYRTAGGWSGDERAATEGMPGVANEYSVIAWNGHFLLVTQDSTRPFSGWIVSAVSATPYGPFRYRADLYRTPETAATGANPGRPVITYNAHAYPQLSSRDTIVVSYNVNSLDGPTSDAGIYRPRFIQIRLR